MHGGISPRLTSVDAINTFERRREPANDTLLADLLWADAVKNKHDALVTFFENNLKSGASVVFGRKPLKALLD